MKVRLRDVLLALFVGAVLGWALATPEEPAEELIDLSATT